jgi:hypothetical protein
MENQTQTTADLERILEKVRKCLALSASDNAGESEAALRQARKLMEKHGITEGQVKLSEVKSVQAGKVPAAKDRASRLLAIVAAAFSCQALRNRQDGVFEFIGKGADPDIAAYTWSVLWRRLEMERTAFHEQMLCSLIDPAWDENDWSQKHRFKWAREDARKATASFVEGWLHNVTVTVNEFAAPKPDPSIADWLAQKYGKLGQHKARKVGNLDADGVKAGLDAGSRVRLHQGVNGKAASHRQLAA